MNYVWFGRGGEGGFGKQAGDLSGQDWQYVRVIFLDITSYASLMGRLYMRLLLVAEGKGMSC